MSALWRLRALAKDPMGRRVLLTTSVTYLGMGLSFLSSPMLATSLGADGRGILAASFTLMQLLSWVGFLSLPRLIALKAEGQGVSLRSVLLLSLLGLVNAVLAFVLAPVVSNGNAAIEVGIRISASALLLNGLGQLGIERALVAGKLGLYNLSRLGYSVIPSLAIIVAFLTGTLSLQFAFVATLVGQIVTIVTGFFLAIKLGGFRDRAPIPFRPALQVWSATALDSVGGRIDQVLLATFATPTVLGVYAVAVTFSSATGALTQALVAATYSRLIARASEGRGDSLGRISAWGAAASGATLTCVLVFLFFFGGFLFGPTFAGLLPVTAVLGVAQALSDQWLLRVNRDTAFTQTRHLVLSSGASAVVVVVGALFLGFTGLLSGISMALLLCASGAVRLTTRALIMRARRIDGVA